MATVKLVGECPAVKSAAYPDFIERWWTTYEDICSLTDGVHVYVAQGASGGNGSTGTPYLVPTPVAFKTLIESLDEAGVRRIYHLANDATLTLDHTASNPTQGKSLELRGANLDGFVSVTGWDRNLRNTGLGGLFPNRPILTGFVRLDSLYDSSAGTPVMRPDATNYPNVYRITLPSSRTFGIGAVANFERDGLREPYVCVNPASITGAGSDGARAEIMADAGVYFPEIAELTDPVATSQVDRVIGRVGGAAATKTVWNRSWCYDATNHYLYVRIPDELNTLITAGLLSGVLATRNAALAQFFCCLDFGTASRQVDSALYVNHKRSRINGLACIGWGPAGFGGNNNQIAGCVVYQLGNDADSIASVTDCDFFYTGAHGFHSLQVQGDVSWRNIRGGWVQQSASANFLNANAAARRDDAGNLMNAYDVAAGFNTLFAQIHAVHGSFMPIDGLPATRGRLHLTHTDGVSTDPGLTAFWDIRVSPNRFGWREPMVLSDDASQPTTRQSLDEYKMHVTGLEWIGNGDAQTISHFKTTTAHMFCRFINMSFEASNVKAWVATATNSQTGGLVIGCVYDGEFRFNTDEGGSNTMGVMQTNGAGVVNRLDWFHNYLRIETPFDQGRIHRFESRNINIGTNSIRRANSVFAMNGPTGFRTHNNQDFTDAIASEPATGGGRGNAYFVETLGNLPDSEDGSVWFGNSTVPRWDAPDSRLEGITKPLPYVFEWYFDFNSRKAVKIPSTSWTQIGPPVGLSGGGGQEGIRNRNFR